MGNCASAKGSSKPNSLKYKDDIDEVSGHLKVDNTKKKYNEEIKEEETKQVDANNLQRNKKKNIKIKQGADNENEPLYEKIEKIAKKKTREDQQLIAASLRKSSKFYGLNDHQLNHIIKEMFYCEVKAGEYVFKQGDNASSYFIVNKGKLEIIINNESKKFLTKGDGFGELALLYNAPRSASVKVTEDSSLWGIDRTTFKNVVESITTKEYDENRKFIDGVAFFNTMTNDQKDAIASVLITLQYQKGQNIVTENEQASSFYIIMEGTVSVIKGGKELRKMSKGDSFGEQALYASAVRGATVKALGDNVTCITLGRDSLTKILGDNIQVIALRNQQKWALEKSEILSKLTKIQVEKVLDAMKIVSVKDGEIIINKGSPCHNKIIAVIEGGLKKKSSPEIVAVKGVSFGDTYLMKEFKNKTYEDDIIAQGDSTLSEITYQDFVKAIGGTIEEVIEKNKNSHETRMLNMTSELKEAGKNVRLEDLIYYKKLGAGMFGAVYLVKEKDQNQFYALKCISKQQVVEQKIERHLKQEKSVLGVVNFPFIMQFIKTFKDQNFLYFLIEYVKGLELYDVIRIINLLGTYDAQFYTGSMILAIEYLHSKGIIYRDLKPENIMIDHTGYMRLIDMGTAKYIKGKGTVVNRTFTIIGTPHYMAPEILTGKGYTLNVDLWSIGICLYEFLCGMLPYGEEAEDPMDVHDEIMNTALRYPSFLKDIKAKRLMDQLLNKAPEPRLGGSFAALKAHPWFDTFDWDKLLDKQLKAPLIPPANKLITDEEIRKMEKLAKKVTTVLEEDNKTSKKYRKEQAADPNWDKSFQEALNKART